MLAEKFVLVLETLIARTVHAEPARYPDGSPKIVSEARHIPISLLSADVVAEPPTKH